jgi:hypothetical protein
VIQDNRGPIPKKKMLVKKRGTEKHITQTNLETPHLVRGVKTKLFSSRYLPRRFEKIDTESTVST